MLEEPTATTESLKALATEKGPESFPVIKHKGKWFRKIPRDVLFSPGGIILIIFAVLMEVIDLIPVPILENLWELPMEIIFGAMLVVIAKVPVLSLAIPFIVERIPILSDFIPSYLIRMFI